MIVAQDAPTRPALRYYGGKFRLAAWILNHFPKHICYIEPCFGGGSVLLLKPRSKVETVNDIDRNVVNFFQVLRDRPQELINKIKLTPWARDEIELHPNCTDDPIEKARRFWLQSWMTIAQTDQNQSFRVSKKGTAQPAAILLQSDYLYSVANRLSGVQIENRDSLDFIETYDTENGLIYFDPPYLKDTRSHADEYAFEVDDQFHVAAAELLNKARAYVVVSGYTHPLYTQLYESNGWGRVDTIALANSQQLKTESLWLSPRTVEALQVNLAGLPLFEALR